MAKLGSWQRETTAERWQKENNSGPGMRRHGHTWAGKLALRVQVQQHNGS